MKQCARSALDIPFRARCTDARGKTTTYSYDALNRRTKAVYADGTSATWQYDQGANGIGRLSKLTDVTGSTSYSYDANGHVTRKIQTIGAAVLTTAYGYDTGGRLASVTYPSGNLVAYAYDAAGRISSVKANGQPLATGVTYMPFGMATGWTAGNGAAYQRTVDLDGRISGLALPASDTLALTYDLASRITGITETGQPAETFTYDALNRLHIYANGAATQTYTYDANGNRASYVDNAPPPVSQTYTIDTASNRLLGINSGADGSFTYDASGNMLSYQTPFAGYTFTYDARNRQTESFVGAIGTPYLINGLGQRVSQYAASAPLYNFAYDEAGHTIGKYDASGNANQQETVWLGDLPVAVLTPAGSFYIAPDHLGAPHQITNASGAVAWQWNHDPFGNGDPTDPLGTFAYDLRFPGQVYDVDDTHLHYNYFRDYDPRTGRYLESDPIGLAGGINTYAYAGGNPVWAVDPLGLSDINFFPTNERIYRYDQNTTNPPGTFTVGGHGDPVYIYGPNGEPIPYYELARLIKIDPRYKSGEPVQLNSCSTGGTPPNGYLSTPFGQELANKLGAPVIAPNGPLWIYKNGKLQVDAPNQWVTFQPQQIN